MTFAEIEDRVQLIVDKTGFQYPVDIIELLREAENEFIKGSYCCEDFKITATSSLGALAGVYDISDLINTDTGFIREIRIGYNGIPLTKIPHNLIVTLYDSSGDLLTGQPYNYWIEREKLRLYPKPNDHANIYLWYVKSNEDDDGTSPIIPSAEHMHLKDYVIAILLEIDGKDKRADKYENKFNLNVAKSKRKYWRERFQQSRIIDVNNSSNYSRRVANNISGGQVVSSADSTIYVWNKVALSDVTTEQTLIVGSDELTLANLDSGQTTIPIFSGDIAVHLGSGYQDRTAYVSTDPSININGVISFGVTLSVAGAAGTPYFDVIVRQL